MLAEDMMRFLGAVDCAWKVVLGKIQEQRGLYVDSKRGRLRRLV